MTTGRALMLTSRASLLATVAFVALQLGADALFDRPTDPYATVIAGAVFLVLFWGLMTLRMKGRNR